MVIVHPEYAMLILEINDFREQIADLIVEKDMLANYICKDVEIDYMLKIGSIEYKRVVAGNNYEKALRRLELVDEQLSKNKTVNINNINKKIETEFKKQNKIEENMLLDIDFAIEMSALDMFDYDMFDEMNMSYFKLQKVCNPIFDINPSDDKIKNYKKIERYYKKGNYKKLNKLAKDFGEEEIFQDEVANLKILREKYKTTLNKLGREIRKIKSSFPYNQRDIIEDENLCRRKKDNLNKEIIEINIETKKIERKIQNKLKKI